MHELLQKCTSNSKSRFELWIQFLRHAQIRRMAEIGVYQGDFARAVLETCATIERYYMLDPWRHLDDWNKPANETNAVFESFKNCVGFVGRLIPVIEVAPGVKHVISLDSGTSLQDRTGEITLIHTYFGHAPNLRMAKKLYP